MAPKKGGRGGKRSKKNEAALEEQKQAREEAQAEDQQAEEQPENGQEATAGEADGAEAGADDAQQQEDRKEAEADAGKGADAETGKEAGTAEKEATADDATKDEEPEPKRQATEAAKAELAADAPIGGGPKPGNVIEEGRIYFIYRPKVNEEHPKSVDDVQRFFMILCPTSRKDGKSRIIAIGKKHMPSVPKRERLFGFVYTVADDVEELMEGLGVERYETKTRGTREKPAARIAGEGVYALTSKDGKGDTHLAYKLELPEEPGEVQKDLEIEKEAAYHISIKNPDIGSPANAGLSEKADFLNDDEKMKQFGNYRWIGAHDPTLLDYPRCELLLIGGGAGDKGHADDETKKHLDQAEHEEVVKALRAAKKEDREGDVEAEESALLAKLHAELHPGKAGVPTGPAAEGEWK